MVVLRKGSEEDLDAFFDLYWISSLEHTHYTGMLDTLKRKEKCQEYIINRQRELLDNPNHVFLVAEDKKKVIGMITGHIGERDEARVYAIEQIGFIDEVCVHPDYRNKDIGQKLLDAILDKLYVEDIGFVGVGVAFKNPAVHFYKSCGFILEGMWLIQQKKSRTKKQRRKK
ncbi:MAG TPA: GNAT family N-acetyltransferase [Candidatus Thermoplasmatota archaeon]|nr:GNAT family N-acetyltransferase [Candidatus Thermoplasmatota archaeon]